MGESMGCLKLTNNFVLLVALTSCVEGSVWEHIRFKKTKYSESMTFKIRSCNIGRIDNREGVSLRGKWNFNASSPSFDCVDKNPELFQLRMGTAIRSGKNGFYDKADGTTRCLILESGDYIRWRYGWGGRCDAFEVMEFTSKDNKRILVKYLIDNSKKSANITRDIGHDWHVEYWIDWIPSIEEARIIDANVVTVTNRMIENE
ncbi:hypothetical protein K4H28_10605 [Deefgea tanakiae]|uniref:Uncharacterized protein n=1 Tax=Deefgea tanakiae TaxID=2865840 RepID=A0ABX8Z2G3_9NEIS|nr:hypothetical protein [Deefgea tanakiae]QZA76768.1 hypothetical protein K4H28_10605 [Deefgea tanakiae]